MIHQLYTHFSSTRSDINEHLPTLHRYAKECDHVTEMGARTGCSTYAFLSSKPKRFVSYDLFEHSNISQAKSLALNDGLDFDFRLQDVLLANIEQTDLLFIDTWHRYGQLKAELSLHANKVNKYIIMHDTVTFGHTDEPAYDSNHQAAIPISSEKIGLIAAIDEFLEENQEWSRHEIFTNNNGLTILARNQSRAIPKVLVISANIGTSDTKSIVDQVEADVTFVYVNDLTYPLRKKVLHPRLIGKIPKMLAWELYPGYDFYIWLDNQFTFSKPDSVKWFISQLGKANAAFFEHPHRNTIKSEILFCVDRMNSGNQYLIDRYELEDMAGQVNAYLADSNFQDNLLIAAGAFIYRSSLVKNRDRNVMTDWYYHNCRWSVQDQLSLPYLLQKHNVDFTLIREDIFSAPYIH